MKKPIIQSPKQHDKQDLFSSLFVVVVVVDDVRSCNILLALLLFDLEQQGAVDAGEDTTKGDGGADEGVELLVTTDGELQVAGRDTLDLEVLCGVAGELEDFGRQVFEHGRHVHGRLCRDAHLVLRVRLEETLDTTAGELEGSIMLDSEEKGRRVIAMEMGSSGSDIPANRPWPSATFASCWNRLPCRQSCLQSFLYGREHSSARGSRARAMRGL